MFYGQIELKLVLKKEENCNFYRSVGAYSCHEDNLTFNIHHNSAMRVHFDWHMSALGSFVLLHFISNWFVRFMATISTIIIIIISECMYEQVIHFELLLLTISTSIPFTWYSFRNLERILNNSLRWNVNLLRLNITFRIHNEYIWEYRNKENSEIHQTPPA